MGWAVIDGGGGWREGQRVHWMADFRVLKNTLLLYYFSCICSIILKIVSMVFVHHFFIIGATFSCVFSAFDSIYSLHTSILSNSSDHELLLNISGSGWEYVLLAQN